MIIKFFKLFLITRMSKSKPSPKSNKTFCDTPVKSSISFLKAIKSKINEIKSNNDSNKKYSILSIIFLCFIEKGKTILSRKEILDFVKDHVINNPNRVISTYKFKKEEKEIISENNCVSKSHQFLNKNKIFKKILHIDKSKIQFELNFDFLNKRKYIIYKQIFGEELQKPKKEKRRKYRKFDNSLSVVKLSINKFKHKKKSPNNEEKNTTNIEIDSSTLSIKESEIKMKKSEEPSISNSMLIESIRQLEPKKSDFIDMNNFIHKSENNSLKKDNSVISSNENSLIMPLFTDSIFKEKYRRYNNFNVDNDKKFFSNSLKEINIIINKGEEFLTLLKNAQFLNLINSNNNYMKLSSYLLNLKKDNYPQYLLKTASDNYTELCKYLDFLLYEVKNKGEIFDGNVDSKFIKIKCASIISSITTKLSQFILEYNYLVSIIEDVFNYEHNFILKEMLTIINYDKDILSKNNVDYIENLLKLELENAISSKD